MGLGAGTDLASSRNHPLLCRSTVSEARRIAFEGQAFKRDPVAGHWVKLTPPPHGWSVRGHKTGLFITVGPERQQKTWQLEQRKKTETKLTI